MEWISPAKLLATAVLLAAGVLGGCSDSPSGSAASPNQGPSPMPPAATTTASPQATLLVTDASGASGPFHLSSLTRLRADVAYQGTPGSHAVRLDVVGPTGTLYAQIMQHLAAGSGGRGSSRHGLEVAGTPIETFKMTGAWRFSLVMDGVAMATASVEILE